MPVFAYAMLALRPTKVWLTFDFAPLLLRQSYHDYTNQIEAYAKMYLLLKKHGVDPFHYSKRPLQPFCQDGKKIMDKILAAIEKQSSRTPLGVPDLIFEDFRGGGSRVESTPTSFPLIPCN